MSKESENQDIVALSSRWMAAIRAVENQRPNRLFTDPFAAELAGEEIIAKLTPSIQDYEDRGSPVAIVRTRFFDDFIQSIINEIKQVVLLGAGMDTRAFRLSWHPDTHIYELDKPEVINFKSQKLKKFSPKCFRHEIAINLAESWSEELLSNGYQKTIPTLWLLEGFLYYLKENEAHQLLKIITDLSSDESYLIADLINQKMANSEAELSKHWHFGCDEPETFFELYGWQSSVVQYGDKEANFGRFTYQLPPRNVPDIGRGFLATAQKKPC